MAKSASSQPSNPETVKEQTETALDILNRPQLALGQLGQNAGSLFWPKARIWQAGGLTGGGLTASEKALAGELGEKLPQGRRPFQAVLVGARLGFTLWETHDPNDSESKKPLRSFVCPLTYGPGVALIDAAMTAFQYTPSPQKKPDGLNKNAFGKPNGGPGAPRCGITLLVWTPVLGDLMEVQTHASYGSMLHQKKAILGVIRDGVLQPVPVVVSPMTEKKKIGNFEVAEHWLGLGLNLEKGSEMLAAFKAWFMSVKDDVDSMCKLKAWLDGSDSQMEDGDFETLKAIVAINPPKER